VSEHAHHHLAVNQVLGAAEAHKAYFDGRRRLPNRRYDFLYWHWKNKPQETDVVILASYLAVSRVRKGGQAARRRNSKGVNVDVFHRTGLGVLILTKQKYIPHTPEERDAG
jgi:hypothetical protein